jgi:acetylglutamate kinase
MSKDITVIKIGGKALNNGDTTIEDIITLQKRGESLVIVHGGGGTVTEWLKKQGVDTRFVRGERVTDLPALEVATAVLTGLVNTEIVADINCHGGKAVGISGVDGGLIESRQKSVEMGYVGTVEKVNPGVLRALLTAGFIPVVSSISLYSVDRPDDASRIINVNGDPVAGELAVAVDAARLIFLTDTSGVRDEKGMVIPRLSATDAESLVASGVISGGMIPKINACLRALTGNTITRIINGGSRHALLQEFEGEAGGTTLYR